MQSQASTVEQYLELLPADRRQTLNDVRAVILKSLDKKNIEEGMQYGMIGYYVPHRVYPKGYHCNPKEPLPYAALASQKNHLSLYLSCIYGSEVLSKQFQEEWARTGKKLDMGKACIRFKTIDDLALDVIAATFKRITAKAYIETYENFLESTAKKKVVEKKAAKKKVAKKSKK
jgi:hypothetical protein